MGSSMLAALRACVCTLRVRVCVVLCVCVWCVCSRACFVCVFLLCVCVVCRALRVSCLINILLALYYQVIRYLRYLQFRSFTCHHEFPEFCCVNFGVLRVCCLVGCLAEERDRLCQQPQQAHHTHRPMFCPWCWYMAHRIHHNRMASEKTKTAFCFALAAEFDKEFQAYSTFVGQVDWSAYGKRVNVHDIPTEAAAVSPFAHLLQLNILPWIKAMPPHLSRIQLLLCKKQEKRKRKKVA